MSSDTQTEARSLLIQRPSKPLFPDYGEGGIADKIGLKKDLANRDAVSNQGAQTGKKVHPYDFIETINLKNFNEHHSTCIETKRDATVGLGFKAEKTVDTLDELTEDGFEAAISDVCEDYWQVGNSYFEVVRSGSQIAGIHHISAAVLFKYLEDQGRDYHWELQSDESLTQKKFARFGDKDDFISRNQITDLDPDEISEIIAIPRPTSLSRWYGFADWLGAISKIELAQCLTQHEFDFFLNRGVPEFIAWFLGGSIDADTWTEISDNFKSHIGYGKSFKSSAFALPDPNLTIQIDRLGIEARQQGIFAEMTDTLATSIVSAHRVPPLLAGIQIPGKLGATNELPNALIAFQVLVIRQAQKAFQRKLALTLGKELSLSTADFEFNTILDEFPMETMDTMARMREPVGAGTRDPKDGLKD